MTRRRLGSPAKLAVVLVLFLPTLVQAQLFPDRTIRRQRPPCATEPPFNAQVRRDYFGYYPTCWSRFPTGWQCPCPNPELPNRDESIRKYGEFGSKKPSVDPEAGPGMGDENPDEPGLRAPGADSPSNIPLPNNGRSPFELDPTPKPSGGAPASGAGGSDPDPFTSPAPPNPKPANPSGRPSAGALDMPKLPETTPSATTTYESPLQPGSIAMTPDATLASGNSAEVRPDLGPLPTQAPVSIPNDLVSPSQNSLGQPVTLTPAPAQAPRRRSFLGSLFGSRDSRNR